MFGLWKLRPYFLFELDRGGGTPDTSSGNPEDAGKAKKEEAAPDTEVKPGTDAKGKKKPVEWTAEQQEELNRIDRETRLDERKKAKTEFEAEVAKAKKDAEDNELQAKQEFKTLAENRAVEIETLKGEVKTLTEAKEQGEKYKAALDKHLKAQTAKLPKHIQTLLSKMDVLEQMEFLTENAKDLGVKLDSVDATPPDDTKTDKEYEASQSKEMRNFVKSIT